MTSMCKVMQENGLSFIVVSTSLTNHKRSCYFHESGTKIVPPEGISRLNFLIRNQSERCTNIRGVYERC